MPPKVVPSAPDTLSTIDAPDAQVESTVSFFKKNMIPIGNCNWCLLVDIFIYKRYI